LISIFLLKHYFLSSKTLFYFTKRNLFPSSYNLRTINLLTNQQEYLVWYKTRD